MSNMRHISKILAVLEHAADGIKNPTGDHAVLKSMTPGVPTITAGDIQAAREELTQMRFDLYANMATVDQNGYPSGVFIHETFAPAPVSVREVLGDRGVGRLECRETPLLTMSAK